MNDSLFAAPNEMRADAVLSPDGAYRYLLTRRWTTDTLASWVTFVMLNPSTANAVTDDPTIRRCIRFARDWGHGGLAVVNLYAYRATKPADLWLTPDPVGRDNDSALRSSLASITKHDVVIAAWGANAKPERVETFRRLAEQQGTTLHCLATNQDNSPCHPLYQPARAVPTVWSAPR